MPLSVASRPLGVSFPSPSWNDCSLSRVRQRVYEYAKTIDPELDASDGGDLALMLLSKLIGVSRPGTTCSKGEA